MSESNDHGDQDGAKRESGFARAASELHDQRLVFLPTAVNEDSAKLLVAQMLALEAEDPDADITLVINSPGGGVYDMFAIIDTMDTIKPDVSTVCVGKAMSAAAVIFAHGAKGKRFVAPRARVMIHQPHSGVDGQASDIEIAAAEVIGLKAELTQMLADDSGKTFEEVHDLTERDKFYRGQEAVDFGLADAVLTPELAQKAAQTRRVAAASIATRKAADLTQQTQEPTGAGGLPTGRSEATIAA